jgi:WhiB family redox-sensing transcriptional regulator
MPDLDVNSNNWMQHAACRGMNPSLFMPERGDTDAIREALATCQTCPVRTECLEYGLEERYGVWGGLSENARRKLRTERFKAIGKRYYPHKPIEHGTRNGYYTHLRRNETPCTACVEARRTWLRIRRAEQRDARDTG